MRNLRIAMIGQRGVPATFGGVEHHVEELGAGLVAQGHEVTVFARSNYVAPGQRSHRGMLVRTLPTVGTKHLDAPAHSAVSTIAALFGRFDIVHYHAVGPSMFAPLPRFLSSAKVVVTVHAFDGDREKWGIAARTALRATTRLVTVVPDAVIAVSKTLHALLSERASVPVVYVPNGVTIRPPVPPGETLRRLGLRPRSYALFVGRFVPEKRPDLLVRAFRRLTGDNQLVLVGETSFTDAYTNRVRAEAALDERVVMPGYLYGDALRELYSNAAVFVLPSVLEGLPLTLLEAASSATPIVASAIAPHVEVLGGDGPAVRLVKPDDETALAEGLRSMLTNVPGEVAEAARLRDLVDRDYRWDHCVEATADVYRHVITTRHERPFMIGT